MAQAVIPATATVLPFEPWSCCAQPPGAVTHPDQLTAVNTGWLPASVPGTVAAALQAAGQWDFNQPRNLDAEDWWYRTAFPSPDMPATHPCRLCLDGLATLAEVWLNGQCLLTTDNMFRAYQIDAAPHLRPRNDLIIGFRSLSEDLKKPRQRPRWKTNLVNHQQLRWRRTSLLGRMPGWSPPVAPVGPWRAVQLDVRPFRVSDLRLTCTVEGKEGAVALNAWVDSAAPIERAILNVGGREAAVDVQPDAGGWRLRGLARIPDPPLWWPHTHGAQPLIEWSLHLDVGEARYTAARGRIGFRELRATQDDGLALQVNGVPMYCRGACWTVNDVMTLGGDEESVTRDLHLARNAGVNMLRVGGTMVYESDHFYRLCDELGILVWQDFMFANMDYPVADEGFFASIDAEARHQLARLSPHPCIAVYCGNSEVEQQAAMFGAPRDAWRNRWFAIGLKELCGEYHPGVAYIPSAPSGGVLPFHVGQGVAHYYGVGAYLRSPEELRKADVKFAAECLAFANIPEAETVNAIMAGGLPVVHSPRWKQRVPRDAGAGWDFDDVRDFYLHSFFAVDPVKLRCFDMPRYIQLGRVVTGEMMAQVFSEWRSGHTNNQGGLVWFFKDLWPAAGWGVIDSLGVPKAAYYYLRRVWLARQITVTDEGLDGLHLHVTNETGESFHGHVELLLLKDEHIIVARQEVPCHLPPRARQTFFSDAILDGFHDVAYSYRFGPPKHDLAVATLFDEQRRVVSEGFYFVKPREPSLLSAVKLDVEADWVGEGCCHVTLCADRFLQSVSFDVKGFLPDDNYFHLVPSRRKVVRFTALGDRPVRFRPQVEALNLRNPVAIRPKGPSAQEPQ